MAGHHTSINCFGVGVYVLFAILAGTFVYYHFFFSPSPQQQFRLYVGGNWQSVTGHTEVKLNTDTGKALIFSHREDDNGPYSSGIWWTEPGDIVNVTAEGAAGNYSLRLQYVNNDIKRFLVPYPAETALFKNAFIEGPPPAEDNHGLY